MESIELKKHYNASKDGSNGTKKSSNISKEVKCSIDWPVDWYEIQTERKVDF